MDGWIKLQRSIKDHWIWKDPIKLKWWIDILLSVNHSYTKVNIGNQLFECGRGQSIQSLSTWAKQWNVSKDKARNFLVLLEKDGMILHENVGKTTRITVCKYDTYQDDLHDEPTIIQRSHNDHTTITHPNKNDKKEKNENNDKNNNMAGTFYSNFDFSFLDENLKEIFLEWLEYKKTSQKFTYKTERALRVGYKRLQDLSGGEAQKAKEIVNLAIANGWKGLFPLDSNKTSVMSKKQSQVLEFESAGSDNNDGYKTTL